MNPTEPPHPPVPGTNSLGLAALGVTDPAFTDRARNAVSLLLDSVKDVLNDVDTFSEALAGGGEFVCGQLGLASSFAPFLEAEAARLVAGLPASNLSALALPAIVAAIDQQPLEIQQALVNEAAARLTSPESTTVQRRAAAARAKTTRYIGPATTPRPDTTSRTTAPAPRPGPTALDVRQTKAAPAQLPTADPGRAAPRASR